MNSDKITNIYNALANAYDVYQSGTSDVYDALQNKKDVLDNLLEVIIDLNMKFKDVESKIRFVWASFWVILVLLLSIMAVFVVMYFCKPCAKEELKSNVEELPKPKPKPKKYIYNMSLENTR